MILAPLPFGGVGPAGRLGIELGALTLLVLWLIRALGHAPALPPAVVWIPLLSLLGLALLQAAPLGRRATSILSPEAVALRSASRPPSDLEPAEARALGRDPAGLESRPALSLDPEASASAARTGAALVAVLLVAITVAATRGARGLALTLLASAAFQGLYGLLVLTSGHGRIWNMPKKYFLDCATGTFVNRSHFACLMAMSLAAATALICQDVGRLLPTSAGSQRILVWTRPAGLRVQLLILGLSLGLAGLLLSYSRAGIALGLAAVVVTVLLGARHTQSLRTRLIAGSVLVGVALVPLAAVGAARLLARYAAPAEEFAANRGRTWIDSLGLIREFPVTGSGFGTFAVAFPLVRSPEIRQFYSHAHNDPLEVVIEGGIVGAGLLAVVAIFVVRLLWRCLGGAKGTLGVGFAAGLAAMLLHGLVDFNFHIPANAVTAAALTGVLIGLPWKARTSG